MQDASRNTAVRRLPRLGNRLARLRGWENDFRQLAGHHGFAELNLPLSLPTSEFKSCLTGELILPSAPRFLDTNGTEWSLRTDLTVFSAQFVCRHAGELEFPFRLFYSGKVFSPQGLLGAEGFRLGHASEFESLEFGAEIIGDPSWEAEQQLLNLALGTLRHFGYKGITIVLGDARVVAKLEQLLAASIADLPERAAVKHQLREVILTKDFARLFHLLEKYCGNNESFWDECAEFRELCRVAERFCAQASDISVRIDPLLTRQRDFYSGLVFDFWARDSHGLLKNVGGGGRYDHLLQHFGQARAAVGFMLRDPQTTGVEDNSDSPTNRDEMIVMAPPSAGAPISPFNGSRDVGIKENKRPLRVALPKGRLLDWGIRLFQDVGIQLTENPESTRKLVLRSTCGEFEFLFVKNSDVVSYVERGIAEVALAGSDLLDESDVTSLLRPVTFGFAQCRLCLAGQPSAHARLFGTSRPRIATKYPHLALRLLREIGIEPELIPLQGSVELASVISFCDAIVDLVETGSTLRENGLVVFRDLTQTRVQLVTSRSFYVQSVATLQRWLHSWQAHGHITKQHFALPDDEVLCRDSHTENT